MNFRAKYTVTGDIMELVSQTMSYRFKKAFSTVFFMLKTALTLKLVHGLHFLKVALGLTTEADYVYDVIRKRKSQR